MAKLTKADGKKKTGRLTDEMMDGQDSRPPQDYKPDPDQVIPDYLKPAKGDR